MHKIEISVVGEKIAVKSPYNKDFIYCAKHNLGGQWENDRKAWCFESCFFDVVREKIEVFYPALEMDFDESQLPPHDSRQQIFLLEHSGDFGDKQFFEIGGRTIAYVRDRDSGAFVGDL